MKIYEVRVISVRLESYNKLYDDALQHWKYCGGTIIQSTNKKRPYDSSLWCDRTDDDTLAQFKLTYQNENIVLRFTLIES